MSRGGLQTKHSVAPGALRSPAEGSKAGGGAAAALLAVRESSNEHHLLQMMQQPNRKKAVIDESDTDPGDVDDPESYSSQGRMRWPRRSLRIRSLLRPDEALSVSGKHACSLQYTQMQDQYTQAVVPLCAYDMQKKVTTND
ncbi:hypothetical protein WJX77_008027 [Trebouxia sp. C0004]